MQSERWQSCTDLFNVAVEQPPDERAAFLERSCDGDEALRRKVELLLKYHDTSGDFITLPAFKAAPELLADDPETLIGQHLGCYRVDAVAGVGGMGVVYVAWDERLGRKVALKLLPQSMVAKEADLERLKREARTASALNHPNIVTIHEIGETDSTHYVATEFIEGITLRERMTKGPTPPNEAVDIAAQVASALCVAHRAGIVHRDIKPENIMLRPDGYVKVLDFGIAKLTQQETLGTTIMLLTQPGTQLSMVLGTTRYMSPEQAMAQQVDARSDLWSLGVVLYEMLAGRAPFEGDTATDVIAAIFDRDPQPLKDSAPIVPRALRSVVNKSLRKDPAERYQTGEEMLSELRAIKEKADGIAARNARWIGVAAVAALLAGLALVYALRGGRTAPARAPAVTDKSIAVLPLQNLSDDKENAFFADGVQDELLSNLSKIKDLKVISRTSVMQYKSGTRRNLKEIAQQLGVSNVVEGSVRRSGDHVRVSVQLIDARTDRHLWGENYDRNLADSVSLQGELATEIAGAVGATLSPQEKARVEAKPTNNPAAYDAYLRARAIPFDWGFALEGDIASAIHLYEQAVRLDPNFTLAWAYLSIAQIQSASKGIDSGPALRARAKDSLNHALSLDPNLPEVHLARGYNEPFTGAVGLEDDTRALAEFRQAEQGLPNSVDVIEAIARMQRGLGHWDDAIAELRRGIELDPRNISASNNLALTYCAMRRFPEALATLDRVLAWDPTNARALLTKADALMAIGDLQAAEPLLANPEVPAGRRARYALFQRNYAAAIEILSKDLAVDRQQRDPGDILSLAFSQQLAGDIAAARATYHESVEDFRRQLEKVEPGSYVEAYTRIHLGAAYAGLGEAASAIAEGQKAMALVPASKDPEFGPDLEGDMARIYAQLGDADHAIPMLKRLLRTPHPAATFLTPATLGLDPIWDPIRNDPRFQELAAGEMTPLREKSIAVLPFQNLSKDEENAFFASGMQDEILTNLAKVADLKVISRTSVMKYKSDLERNLREIAETLGVSHVVEGSVQRAGGRVRVSAQLIDARNDAHLWAERYDRDVADVFAIQSEIAQRIADQLRAKLSAAEKAAIAERPTTDLVAYAYYTKAREIDVWRNWEGAENSMTQKVGLLEKAIQRDPNFALAYCALAKTKMYLANNSKDLDSAKDVAEAALRVRPDLGEAHLELARYYWLAPSLGFDMASYYARARDELAIVRSKLPNNAEALWIEAMIGRHENRWDASLANLQKANALDPRNSELAWDLRRIYFEMRRYSELEQFNASRGPLEEPWTKMVLAEIKLAQGDPVAAQSLLEQVPLDFSPDPLIWAVRFTAALYLRDYDAVNRVIAATPAKGVPEVFDGAPESWGNGLVARARGDKQKALMVFAAARKKVDATWGDKPKDSDYLSLLARLDAGLGRKEEAILEARRAVELLPIAKDSVAGPALVANLALVYAWTGERDRALEQLEIVATIPGSSQLLLYSGVPMPTYGDLRFNPCWDSLRGDPRFDKIVAAAKAASKYALEPLPEKSIAVLPFENRSEDKASAYFAGGIQDEILTRLSKIADLKVISRTSTQHYKSAPENLPEIAKQLGVAHILEGSVQKSGDAVRVNVQLIKAANDSHLWADTFDRKLSDIFSVESEVAKAIADQLRAKLTGQEEQAISAKPTDNVEAYDAYLRGLAFEGRSSLAYGAYSPDLVGQAAHFFERAVQLDPNFALAWARLSHANAHLYFSGGFQSTSAQRDTAKRALDNAQRLEPNSPETLLALGYYQYYVLGDYGLAKSTFRLVSRMLPSSSEVPYALGRVTRREGNWDESIAYFEQALTLEPRNVELLMELAETYGLVRQFPAALKLYDRVLDIKPNDLIVMAEKASIYQAQGNLQEAATFLSEINEQTPDELTFDTKISQLRLERNYGEAVRLLQARLAQFHFDSQDEKTVYQVALAFTQRLAGDTAGAKATAEQSRDILERLCRDQSRSPRARAHHAADLSQAYAAMGEKDSALKTAAHAIMLWPSAKDPKVGPGFEENLVLIETIFGENNRVISTLARLLQTPYTSFLYLGRPVTPALLRLDPIWDPIRNDPRFGELVAEKKP